MTDAFVIEEEIEVLQDFYDEFCNSHLEIEHLLAQLETQGGVKGLFVELYRELDSIRNGAGVANISPITDSLESIQTLLEKVMKGELEYCHAFCEVIMLLMDRLLVISREAATTRQIAFELYNEIQNALRPMLMSDSTTFEAGVSKAIAILTGQFVAEDSNVAVSLFDDDSVDLFGDDEGVELFGEEQTAEKQTDKQTTEAKPHADIAMLMGRDNDRHDRDLALLQVLAGSMQERHEHWGDRTDYVMRFALGMNALAGNPVDPVQLEAAVYMHDFAMAKLPDLLIQKREQLSPREWAKVVAHPMWGRDLLNILGGWEQAAEIVMQHHERPDGKGYPMGITEDKICPGAKILAICDAFYSMTHERPDRESKRSMIRAVAEITACRGSQFSAKWVAIFHKVLKIQYQAGAV